ncbi:MAG: choice-of-anchor R domain-containing protein [Anaerolineales bacterium]|nr:choice-of-anchor R domain-containing protein [Anaerolineales bacterium]
MWLKFLKHVMLAFGLVVMFASGSQVGVRAHEEAVNPQTVLYNQIAATSQEGVSSTRVTGTFPTYTQGADDFLVPGPAWFIVNSIEVRGEIVGAAPNSVLVEFYNTVNNLPGNLIYSQTANIGGTGGNFILTLPTPAVLPASGTPYWLSVQSQSNSPTVVWFWKTRSLVAGSNPAAYKTATLPGCTNVWATRGTCEPVAGAGPDNQFSLSGIAFTPTAFLYLPLIRR